MSIHLSINTKKQVIIFKNLLLCTDIFVYNMSCTLNTLIPDVEQVMVKISTVRAQLLHHCLYIVDI